MQLIADGLLIATALTAALYCLVLSRRLRRLTDTEAGMGAQIAELSRVLGETRTAVSDTRRGLAETRSAARNATDTLSREVALARETVTEIRKATAEARRAADGMGLPDPGQRPDAGDGQPDPPEFPAFDDADDPIPDWPDGVFEPDPSEAAAADPGGSAGPDVEHAERAGTQRADSLLRVERMAL